MKVSAPASTANLGPGFDCLGAALSLRLEIDTDAQGELPRIVKRAVRAGAGRDDATATGAISSDIPRALGLGSSAACIAAGLLIGAAQAGREADPAELLAAGTPIEGHPDNLAAALFGGLTLVLPDGHVRRFDPDESVRPVILQPTQQLATAEARRVLPDDVPRAAAVANAARTAGLLSMLSGAAPVTPELLLECTEDLVHQPYRMPLMPRTQAMIERLRREGVAAALSGAGPSVVCLVMRGEEDKVRASAGELTGGPSGDVGDWQILELDWDREGARIVR